MNAPQNDWELTHGFAASQDMGNIKLGRFEAMYEELFAEVIEDGVITRDERKRLEKMADNFGLDRDRLRRLEVALQAAYQTHHRVRIREEGSIPPSAAVPENRASLIPVAPTEDMQTQALTRRVAQLQARIRELEAELEEARMQAAVEVDLSDLKNANAEDTVELVRRLRHDPRDAESLHALFRALVRGEDKDRKFCIATCLVYLGCADAEEKALCESQRITGLQKPTAAVSADAWRKLLFHPDQELVIGDVFATVVSSVLLGRVSALRRDGALVPLNPAQKQEPEKSTLQAVRCFHWATAVLGFQSPSIYTDPSWEGLADLVVAMPPALKLGKMALSSRTPAELAFAAGRHLGHLREELFVRDLLPDLRSLEEVFLAALSVGNPGLPLQPHLKELVVPIAKAIEPLLEPAQVDRLRGHFLRFVEEGGRANLQRWARSVEFTCNRAGLLLCHDLRAAHNVIELEDRAHLDQQMDDLLSFVISERYSKLRKQIGVAIS